MQDNRGTEYSFGEKRYLLENGESLRVVCKELTTEDIEKGVLKEATSIDPTAGDYDIDLGKERVKIEIPPGAAHATRKGNVVTFYYDIK